MVMGECERRLAMETLPRYRSIDSVDLADRTRVVLNPEDPDGSNPLTAAFAFSVCAIPSKGQYTEDGVSRPKGGFLKGSEQLYGQPPT